MTNDSTTPATDGPPEMRRRLAEKFSLLASGSRDNWEAWLGDADAFLASLATPTPADVAGLCERLNRVQYVQGQWLEPHGEVDVIVDADMADWPGVHSRPVNPDGPEAATRIEAYAAEVERLKLAGLAYRDTRNEYITKFKAAEAERDRMKAALEAVELARHTNEEAHWLRATKLTDAALTTKNGDDHAKA